jgi:hypothetical protein
MRELAQIPTPGNLAVVSLVGIFLFCASILPSRAANYSSDPAPGNFKDVGVGYRFRVSSISAGVATFEVLPKTGTFGSPGRAVIKKDSINGTIVGTGIPYGAGASTAGFVSVDVSTAGLTSGSMDFYAVREGDTNVWDGPITVSISGSNDAPTVSVASATMQPNGDVLVNWTANDDLTSLIGTDLYLSINDNLNSFSFASKRTPPNSVGGVPQSFTFPAAFLGKLGMNPGGTFRVRVNVFDGSQPQLEGSGYTPRFVYTLPEAPAPPTIRPRGPTRFTSVRNRIVLVGTAADATEVRFSVGGGAFRRATGVSDWRIPVRLTAKRTLVKVRATGPGGNSRILFYSITRR